MKRFLLLIVAALLLSDLAARADEVRIYAGSRKQNYFDSNANTTTPSASTSSSTRPPASSPILATTGNTRPTARAPPS